VRNRTTRDPVIDRTRPMETCSAFYGFTTEDLPENRIYVRSAHYALLYDRGETFQKGRAA
jgi:hypothetical protein